MNELLLRIAGLSQVKRELLLLQLRKARGSQPPGTMTVEELEAEAYLDPAIGPAAPYPGPTAQPSAFFLTGATGFIGAFLLADLLRATRATVYCLVRAASPGEGLRRIQRNLGGYRLWRDEWAARVVPVEGDLALPMLGLAAGTFSNLADQVDAIYHCGALVKWTYPYSALKAANVQGTQEILRLAAAGRVKPVHFISTVGVFASPDWAGKIVSEREDLWQSGSLGVGYAQSKWVAERLVRIAGERGLPVTIYRPATGGDSQTGAFNANDHVSLLIKGCVQLGCAPELDLRLQLAPVDYASRAIVQLAARPESQGATYHLVNPGTIPWNLVFEWLAEYGFPIPRLPAAEFMAALLAQISSSSANALSGLSPLLAEFTVEHLRLPLFDCRQTLDRLAGSGITCPALDTNLWRTYFDGFVRSGFLSPAVAEPRPAL